MGHVEQCVTNMHFKKMKYYIYDFAVMLFVVIAVSVSMVYLDLITISFRAHFLTIALIIILIAYCIQLLNQVLFLGIRAICDLIFQNYVQIQGVYVGPTE